MTKHVRTSYRSHRRASWALVLGIVALVAAAVIPLASGAPQKYYTLEVPSELCSMPTTQTLTLKLVNKTRNQNLGSANITAPPGIDLVKTPDSAVTKVEGAGSSAAITVNQPDGFDSIDNTIRLRNLTLPTNESTATITVEAVVTAGGAWDSTVKQSNSFSDSGPGNLFAPQGAPFTTSVSACNAEYVFVEGPEDAERGSAQTVKVQLQLGGQPVDVSGTLTLSALQDGELINDPDPDVFQTLTTTANENTDTWTFSVIGHVSGTGYALQAGDTISDPTFRIADGLCNPNYADPEHLNSSCSLSSDLNGGNLEAGVTINNHKLAPIAINFEPGSAAQCDPETWNRASYTVGGVEYFLPGVELDFGWGGGVLQVIYRVRNSDWVLTDVSRGNNDIEICAGAKHADGTKNGPDGDAFPTKDGSLAEWDGELYWGVLPTVSNPSKVKAGGYPAVCARGTQDLPTGPGEPPSIEKWRTWTICIPEDWDWKNYG